MSRPGATWTQMSDGPDLSQTPSCSRSCCIVPKLYLVDLSSHGCHHLSPLFTQRTGHHPLKPTNRRRQALAPAGPAVSWGVLGSCPAILAFPTSAGPHAQEGLTHMWLYSFNQNAGLRARARARIQPWTGKQCGFRSEEINNMVSQEGSAHSEDRLLALWGARSSAPNNRWVLGLEDPREKFQLSAKTTPLSHRSPPWTGWLL